MANLTGKFEANMLSKKKEKEEIAIEKLCISLKMCRKCFDKLMREKLSEKTS